MVLENNEKYFAYYITLINPKRYSTQKYTDSRRVLFYKVVVKVSEYHFRLYFY